MGAGININEHKDVSTGISVSASANLVVLCPTAQTVFCHVTATSSLAGVWEGTFDDIGNTSPQVAEGSADWFPLPALIVDTTAITENLPGATITPDDDDVMAAATLGSRWVRFRRTAGSGTVSRSVSNATLQDIQAASSGGSAVSVTETQPDDSAFVAADPVFPMGALADETSPDSVDEGDWGAVRMTLDRMLRTVAPADTPYHLVADGTDELLISASARRLTAAQIFHINDAPVFAKWYDKATAPAETDTPIWVTGGPSNATAANGAGNNSHLPPGGIALTNGLGVRVVKGLTDASDTAADASEVIVNAAYTTRA